MKKMLFVCLIVLLPALASAQLKTNTRIPSMSQVLKNPATNFILNLFSSNKLQMHHTFSFSLMTMGGQSAMVNSYMNTIDYQISSPLYLRVNLGLLNSPFNSFNISPDASSTKFFGGAELQYQPSKNTLLKVGISMNPGSYYYPNSPLGRFNHFGLENDH